MSYVPFCCCSCNIQLVGKYGRLAHILLDYNGHWCYPIWIPAMMQYFGPQRRVCRWSIEQQDVGFVGFSWDAALGWVMVGWCLGITGTFQVCCQSVSRVLHDNITELARSIDVISVNLLVTGALFIYELYITFVKLFLYIFLLSILIFRIVKEKKKYWLC